MFKLKKQILILMLLTMPLFLQANSHWNGAKIFVQIDQKLLRQDAQLRKNKAMLINFYQQRQNRPLWLERQGIKGKKVMQLLAEIQRDPTLNPQGYIQKKSKSLKKNLQHRHSQREVIQLELQLTSLYYEFIQHTVYGEIDWQQFETHLEKLKESHIDTNWVRYPLKFDILALMSQENISQTVRGLLPKGYQYRKLVQAVYRLYKIKWRGGWKKLPVFKSLKKGNSSPIVQYLRHRLTLSGDYKHCATKDAGNLFDGCLDKAVKRFQRRHSLTADGAVGRGTQRMLNLSVESKINRLLLNIDRIKWLPRNNNERYIVVNIPEYTLHYYTYGREVAQHKVIIGDTKHPTPIFSNKLSYITLNPYWKLPEGIVRKEVVPAMVKKYNYIQKHGLEAHETWEENSSIVSLKEINWSDYLTKENPFPYRLMQGPGPKNALGKVKFKFPNKFSVYLHDTPNKSLFKKRKRAFSHGCVRLSQPLKFLRTLSKSEANMNWYEMKSILAKKRKKEINFSHKVPINLVYLTTWVNKNNELIFGEDIYQYDKYQQRFIR